VTRCDCGGCEAGYGCDYPDEGLEHEPAFYAVFRGRLVDPRMDDVNHADTKRAEAPD
jgi:hypothetical protein